MSYAYENMEELQPIRGSNTNNETSYSGQSNEKHSQENSTGGPAPQAQYPLQDQCHAGTSQGQNRGCGALPIDEASDSIEDVNVRWQGEIPEHDVEDNPNAMPNNPSDPPLEMMDSVDGYQNIGFDPSMLPLPSNESTVGEPPKREVVTDQPKIDVDGDTNALKDHFKENCCNAAKEFQTKDLQHSSAYHYTLETWGEVRSISWAFEPYKDQPIDGKENGIPKAPWDIKVPRPLVFANQKSEIEVPHTALIKPCHHCKQSGKIRCHRCQGRGKVLCSTCQCRGPMFVCCDDEQKYECCSLCHDGRYRCPSCNGNGMVMCNCCHGYSRIKCYIKLTVVWTYDLQEYIVKDEALPYLQIRSVSGKTAFKEEQRTRVSPITYFTKVKEVSEVSERLLNQHAQDFRTERILMQRQSVSIIPVTKWKECHFVFGTEKKVYCSGCCESYCLCNIL